MANLNISNADLLELSTEIVAAYVSKNTISRQDLPELMMQVHSSLIELAGEDLEKEPLVPAVPIKDSVTNDFIICLEDGKKLKMLKRYIRTRYDLSPGEYRAKWGLPSDYPMVAPEYASRRSKFAKDIGLGVKR